MANGPYGLRGQAHIRLSHNSIAGLQQRSAAELIWNEVSTLDSLLLPEFLAISNHTLGPPGISFLEAAFLATTSRVLFLPPTHS